MASTAERDRAQRGSAPGTNDMNGRASAAEPAGPHASDENGGSWPLQHQPAGRPSTPPMQQTPEQLMLAMAQQQWLFMQQQQQHMQQLQQQQQDKQHGGVPGPMTPPPYPYPMQPMGSPAPGIMPQLSPQQMAAMVPYPPHMTQHMPYMYPPVWGMVTPPASPPNSYAASSSQGSPGVGSSPQQLMNGTDSRRDVQITDVTNVDERSLPQRAATWYLSNLSVVASAYLGMWLYVLGLTMFLVDICYRLATRHARLAIRAAAAVSAVQEDASGSDREALAPLLEMPDELREGESARAVHSVARALAYNQGANGTSASSTQLAWMSPQQWQQREHRQQRQQQQQHRQQEDESDVDVLPWPYHELSDSLAVAMGLWVGVWLRVVRTMGWQLPLSAARSVAQVALIQLRTAAWVAFLVARATYALAMTTYVSVPTRDLAHVIGYVARTVDTGRRAASAALGIVSRTADRFNADATSSFGGGITLEPRAVVGAAAAALQYVLAALLKLLERTVSALVGLRRRVLDSGVQVVPLAALLANVGTRSAAMAGAVAGAAVGLAEAGATWIIEALSHGAPTVARQMLVTYLSFLFTMVRRLGEESARLLGQLAALMWEHGGNGLLSTARR